MNVRNFRKILTIAIFAFVMFSNVFVVNVSAQSAGNASCVPGTGVNGVACVPCYRGPYNICAPSTGIMPKGSFINDEQLFFILATVALGILFVANGKIIKNKLAE